jgi:hypothetical protein
LQPFDLLNEVTEGVQGIHLDEHSSRDEYRQHAPLENDRVQRRRSRVQVTLPRQRKSGAGTLTTEEAGEKAAVFKGFKFGFEPDALFGDAGLLFDEFYLLLDEAVTFGLELDLLLF